MWTGDLHPVGPKSAYTVGTGHPRMEVMARIWELGTSLLTVSVGVSREVVGLGEGDGGRR